MLVRSEQCLHLPADIGGFVFPKNGHFALKGILITNFGHIDPGFKGHLKFTMINMGRNYFALEVGEAVACVVLFGMNSPASPPWKGTHDTDNYESHAKVLPRAFMDLDSTIWPAPGLDDTQLGKSSLPLELHRAQITDRRVSAFRVVEALDIVKHVCLCFIACPVRFVAGALGLQ